MKPSTRSRVLIRASGRCELCGRKPSESAELHVGHLLSVKIGKEQGLTDEMINSDANLCAMCDECNLGLGDEVVPLRLAVAMVMARNTQQNGDEQCPF